MPSDFAFRLSTYLTLGLSCLCLGYAEWDLLPEASVLAGLVIVSLVISFRAEGRFELSLKAANRVGFVIALAGGGWLAHQFYSNTSLIYTLPWPASLLPYLGPLLMVLMPAKLFRPKHVGDWWAMQGIGLAAAGLASAMAEDEIFGILLSLYAVAGVCSLTLFYYRRSAGALLPIPHADPDPPTTVLSARAGDGRAVFRRALGWVGLAGFVAFPLFFLTPRTQTPQWHFGKSRETGFGADQMVDLNRTGEIRVNREVAWEVKATHADGRPKDDLNLNQRWRGAGYHRYDSGVWTRTLVGGLMKDGTIWPIPMRDDSLRAALPDLGPDAYYLSFAPRARRLEPVVADPANWRVREHSPIASESTAGPRLWTHLADTSFRPPPTARGRIAPYMQVVRPPGSRPGDEDLGPPFELAVPHEEARALTGTLFSQCSEMMVPGVRDFALRLLDRLAAGDPVLATARDRADTRRSFMLAPEDFEPVARAFAAHLAESGDYTYTLAKRRTDRSTDPVEDFLLKTRTGHCERFAAALSLLCRAVGIPTIYVLGYKGCEHEGNGVYLIRQEHAHAWVEVLVMRPAPADYPVARGRARPGHVWHWLSLDPTPTGADEPEEGTIVEWFGTARQTWANFFLDFIVGYNSDRHQQTVEGVRLWFDRYWWGVFAIPALGAIGFGARRAYRHWRASHAGDGQDGRTDYPWFDQLRVLLLHLDLSLTAGATPRETARAAAEVLRADPRTAGVAQIPVTVTQAFYRARYGNRPPTPDETAGLAGSVERLGIALRAAGYRPGDDA